MPGGERMTGFVRILHRTVPDVLMEEVRAVTDMEQVSVCMAESRAALQEVWPCMPGACYARSAVMVRTKGGTRVKARSTTPQLMHAFARACAALCRSPHSGLRL